MTRKKKDPNSPDGQPETLVHDGGLLKRYGTEGLEPVVTIRSGSEEDAPRPVRLGRPPADLFVRIAGPIGTVRLYREPSGDRGFFLVSSEVADHLQNDVDAYWLFTFAGLNGQEGIWPVKANPRSPYARQLLPLFERAGNAWGRFLWSHERSHEVVVWAEGDLGEPISSGRTPDELAESAFAGRILDTEAHPIVRALRGIA